ncbi:MAG: WecB/TagA/CpsF family glycosyltransferase, partial [Actinomycetota bacterium]|nr:WecB/TagA/CpsF family glycosyltransferase [Actinomycetota bacterium]
MNLDHIHHFGDGGRWNGALDLDGTVQWFNLIDGAPLASQANRLTGTVWPRLAGSDLIDPILRQAEAHGLRVGFLGGSPETQIALQESFAAKRPALAVSGWWAPERSVLSNPEASRSLAEEIAAAETDILVVGLGKPRQELWIAQHGSLTGAKVLLAFGAVVDFLAGRVRRAPEWLTSRGLEWAWRLSLEPQRLGKRYLLDGPPAYLRVRRSRPVLAAMAAQPPSPVVAVLDAATPTPGRFSPVDEPADVVALVVTYNNAADIDPLLVSLRE